MKRIVNLQMANALTILLILSVAVTSCKKDNGTSPEYAGTWIATGTMSDGSVSYETKEILGISENSFTRTLQIKDSDVNKWLDYVGMKGSLAVSGDQMSITITHIGMAAIDMMSGMPVGSIIYYSDGSDEFNAILALSEMDKVFVSKFSVSGNTLTMMMDLNGDGDYADEDETLVYMKQ